MKINYEFVTDEKTEAEVSEELGQVILAFENEEQNKNRAETRRHSSIENVEELGGQFADKTINIENNFIANLEIEKLHMAIERLLPQQKELISRVFFGGESIVAVARDLGITKQACNNRLNMSLPLNTRAV